MNAGKIPGDAIRLINLFSRVPLKTASAILFLLSWKIRPFPFTPAPFEGVDFLKSQTDKLQCHTGTGFLIWSGAVKYNGLSHGILLGPGFHFGWVRIFPNRPFDSLQTHFPLE